MKQTVVGIILTIMLCGCHQLHEKEYNLVVTETSDGRYLHFSLDDVQECMRNLSSTDYESIFTDPTLQILKTWHDRYGIVASLYVQGDFTINSKYAAELVANSDWLKFGYHGDTPSPQKTGIEEFYKQVMDSIGSKYVIDLCPRIHCFHADHGTIMKLKGFGCKGFLTCDDWEWNSEKRESNYYLTIKQNELLDKNNRLWDTENHTHFIKSDFRLEHIAHRWGNIENLLNYYNNQTNQNKEMIVFGHEWNFMEFIEQADSIFAWAKTNNYEFDYPANR